MKVAGRTASRARAHSLICGTFWGFKSILAEGSIWGPGNLRRKKPLRCDNCRRRAPWQWKGWADERESSGEYLRAPSGTRRNKSDLHLFGRLGVHPTTTRTHKYQLGSVRVYNFCRERTARFACVSGYWKTIVVAVVGWRIYCSLIASDADSTRNYAPTKWLLRDGSCFLFWTWAVWRRLKSQVIMYYCYFLHRIFYKKLYVKFIRFRTYNRLKVTLHDQR